MNVGGNRVADVQVLDLRHRHDIAGDRLGDWFLLLSLHEQKRADARRLAGAHVDKWLLRGHLSGQNAEERQVADELVGQRLEDLGHELAGFVGLDDNFVGALGRPLGPLAFVCLGGRRRILGEGVEQFPDADVLLFFDGRTKDWDDRPFGQCPRQGVGQLLGGYLSFAEVLLHQGFITFHDRIDALGSKRTQVHRATGRRGSGRVQDADDTAELRLPGRSGH